MAWDFIAFCRKHNITYKEQGQHEHASYGWVQVNCPWCHTTKFHLGYAIQGNAPILNCWHCGKRSLWNWMIKLKLNPMESGAFSTKRIGQRRTVQKESSVAPLPLGAVELTERHIAYLKQRGFNAELLIRQWGLLATDIVGEHPHRIVIPIYNHEGVFVGWTARGIVSCKNKYVTPHGFGIHDYLYGEHTVVNEWIIVVEGAFDCWRLGQSVVGLFGSACSTKQLRRLAKYKHVFLLLDGDKQGASASQKLFDDIGLLTQTTQLACIDYGANDPAELSSDGVRKIYQDVFQHLKGL